MSLTAVTETHSRSSIPGEGAAGDPREALRAHSAPGSCSLRLFRLELFTKIFPVVHRELLYSQEGVVAHLLVLVVHVVHHQLLPTQLFDDPAGQKPHSEHAAVDFPMPAVSHRQPQPSAAQESHKEKLPYW